MQTGSTLRLLFVAAFTLVWASCASPKVNWKDRVGTYTYDQAVADLGAPDRVSLRDDGSIVADWHKRRGRTGVSVGFGAMSGPIGVGASAPVSDSGPRALRLTFGTNKVLQGYEK